MTEEREAEIEELLRVNIKLTRENNRILKKMRRAAVLSFWSRVLFFLCICGALYYMYQHYVRTYMEQVEGMYGSLQEGVDTVKSFPQMFGL